MKMGFGGKMMNDYEEINSCIYYSITGYADLPKEGENHRNRCYSCFSFPTIRE